MNDLSGVAFWVFVAVVVVVNVWREVVIRREAQVTIRLAIEKGQQLDAATIDKLIRSKGQSEKNLLVGGGVTLATGLGLPIMGYFIARGGDSDAYYPLLGVGALVSLVGVALLVLSSVVRSRRTNVASQGLS